MQVTLARVVGPKPARSRATAPQAAVSTTLLNVRTLVRECALPASLTFVPPRESLSTAADSLDDPKTGMQILVTNDFGTVSFPSSTSPQLSPLPPPHKYQSLALPPGSGEISSNNLDSLSLRVAVFATHRPQPRQGVPP